jgi:predicted acetyltransferase
MDPEIRTIDEGELEAFFGALAAAFGDDMTPEDIELDRTVTEVPRSIAAYDGQRIVGTTSAYSMSLTVPGGTVPMPGVTMVSVLPTHRRRGLLRAMMRRQLDDFREAGEAVAGLWASESSIYGRYGYGLAAAILEVEIARERTAFARPFTDPGRTSLVDKDDALKVMPEVYARVLPARPGMLERAPQWWDYLFSDQERHRHGAGPLQYVVHEGSGGPDGYAAYAIKEKWEEGFPAGRLSVKELIAETPEAYAGLWNLCLNVDLISRIQAWPRPVDEPLPYLLAEPRRLRMVVRDGLWVRLIDVPAALAARTYGAEGEVVLEVRDEFCPWNQGRFRLAAGPQGASSSRTRARPDILLDAEDLGAAYLGGTSFHSLRWAGRVEERTDGAVRRADSMFGWRPAPWCAHVF